MFLPRLLDELQRSAPGVDISVRQVLPVPGEPPQRAWRSAWAELEERAIDIAIVPTDHIPTRFSRRILYKEDFVIAMRAGHPLHDDPSLARYCEAQHLVVSLAGDPHGFVDEILAQHGRSRRVALTVPNFMFALAVIAETDQISALPRRFAAVHAARFGVVTIDAPVPLVQFELNIVVPEVALMDAGLAWLVTLVQRTGSSVTQ